MTTNTATKRAVDYAPEDYRLPKRVCPFTYVLSLLLGGAEPNLDYSIRITKFIIIYAGPEEKHFTVDLCKICTKPNFFLEASLQGRREIRVYRLPEISPGTLSAYKIWMYTGDIEHITEIADRMDERRQLTDLYLAAKLLDDMALRHRIVLALFLHMELHDEILDPGTIWRIWDSMDSTYEGALMRKMIVEALVARQSITDFIRISSQYPEELVEEVTMADLPEEKRTWCTVLWRLLDYEEEMGACHWKVWCQS